MRQVKDMGWVPSNDPQAVGSALTYARRYSMSAILGVSAEDDDGNRASGVQVRDVQASRVQASRVQASRVQANGNQAATRNAPAKEPEHWCSKHQVQHLQSTKTGVWGHVLEDGTPCLESQEPDEPGLPAGVASDVDNFLDTPLGALQKEVYEAEMEWADFETTILKMPWPEWVALNGNTETAHARWKSIIAAEKKE